MVPLTPEEKAKADRRLFKAEIVIPNGFGVKETHNEVVFTTPKFREPGAAFDYSSFNTQLLGLIIEEVTDVRLAEALAERLWIPAAWMVTPFSPLAHREMASFTDC